MSTPNIVIRQIESFSELRAVEELQKEVWGIPDLDVVPLTHLVAVKAAGGVLLGAFDGATLAGFVYGFVAEEGAETSHHSHMLAVKPAYRNLNLGYRLKLAQREEALAQGINLITWTFDPLQSLNAYFNFTKLGVIADRYLINFYGEEAASFLHRSGTDRLWVKWLLTSERVVARVGQSTPAFEVPKIEPLIRVAPDDRPIQKEFSTEEMLIEIPGNINNLQQKDPELVVEWREHTRRAFSAALDAGYVVADFSRQKREEKDVGVYLLTCASNSL
jgi:predicted GNAT superfamily acetyltransferase